MPAHLALAAALAFAWLSGCGADSPSADSGDGAAPAPTGSVASGREGEVRYVNTSTLDLRYHQETAEDVVRSSDQVVIVRASSVEEVEDMPLSPGEKNEPRTIFREISFRVESSVWERPGEAHLARGDEFTALTGGTLSPQREKTTYRGIAFIEPGQQYLMPVTMRMGEWSPELPLATFPVGDSEIALAPHQDTRLARAISGMGLSSLPDVFAQAERTLTLAPRPKRP